MTRKIVQLCSLIILMATISNGALRAQNPLIETEIENKVDSLLSIMTIEEKIGQMNQHNGSWDLTGPIPEDNDYVAQRAALLKNGGVGSLLNVAGAEAT